MHLQQRNDACAPTCAHPELGVPRRRALDQCVHCFVRFGAPQRGPAIPRMRWIFDPALGLLTRAWTRALGPGHAEHFPMVKMPARAVVKFEISLPLRNSLAVFGKLMNKGQPAVVSIVDCARVGFSPIDHAGELANAGAERLGKVGVLCRFPLQAGELGDERVKVGGGIVLVARDGLPRSRQLVARRVVHNKTEFLLRDVWLGPDFTLFRQKDAANESGQLFVVGRHQLQWRIGIGKAQRACATLV